MQRPFFWIFACGGGPNRATRTFHDAVLGRGAVPLDILEGGIMAYIEEEKAGE